MHWIFTQNKPKAIFKQRSWFIRFQVSLEDPIWNIASFFCDVFFSFFQVAIIPCWWWTTLLRTSEPTFFYLCFTHTVSVRATLSHAASNHNRSSWCGASTENKMNKWTDIYGLHLLSSCLHDYTCVARNMDLLREKSVTVSGYPLLHGSASHWEAYSGWELILLKWWDPTWA